VGALTSAFKHAVNSAVASLKRMQISRRRPFGITSKLLEVFPSSLTPQLRGNKATRILLGMPSSDVQGGTRLRSGRVNASYKQLPLLKTLVKMSSKHQAPSPV
jgi:hypothetical protein